ncbi:hypothetical protein HY085_01825 [Candidatus Gottesmanbacteria bacterium]|nr:hypothetical protein [Candidatus Gottesmanbacteria bacterium]
MIRNSKNFKKGQITILVLLLGLMGLTVSLSAASRSLSDLKQVSYVDFGTKAFAAAEAGLQFGLNQLSQGTINCGSPGAITVQGINVSYEVCGGTNSTFPFPGLLKDDVTQIDLSLVNLPASTKYKVFWNNPASLEISVVSKTNSGVYSLRRLAYRGSPDISGGTFSTPDGSGSSCGDAQHTYHNNSYNNCAFFDSSNNPQDQLMRIKAINNVTDVEMVAEKPGSQNAILIGANYKIVATATTTNGTVKKVQAVKTPPTMPAIFDYVLFSNSSINR